MKKQLLIAFAFLVYFNFLNAQSIYKPQGCSASTGPGVSTVVLAHADSRYHLITANWATIEPSPGVFDFTGLQTAINTVKSYNKKYALAIGSGGPGSPDWLIDSLGAPFINYTFSSTPYKLPLFWDTIVQTRIQIMVNALSAQFAADTSLALVYVTQMTANGIEGHLNGIPMSTMYGAGFTPTLWISAAKQTIYYYANSFPDKAIAFEVHEVDTSEIIPQTIIYDMYNDSSLCQRVGAAIWWLSGKITYQPDLINVLENFPGDKYAQLIGNSTQPWRFKDSLISTAFDQAQQLNIRYIEPWLYEYQNNTIDTLLYNFNAWVDTTFLSYSSCNSFLGLNENIELENNLFLVYPNPTSNTLFIRTKHESANPLGVEIINSIGQTVVQQHLMNTLADGSFSIDLDGVPPGFYFLKITSAFNNETQVIKFIKE